MSDNERMRFVWKNTKNHLLKAKRAVCFEDVLVAVAEGKIIDIMANPSPKYLGQKVYVLELKNYPHFVPFRDLDENTRELITIIPSRKLKNK